MDAGKFAIYFGYAMAAVFCCLGIVVLYGGVPGLEIPPSQVRTLSGIVLLLYSIYRFITTRIKAKQTNEERSAL